MKCISLKKIVQSIIFIQSIIVDKYNIFCKNKPKISKLIIDKYGTKRWSINGVLHREGGPAIEWEGIKNEWYMAGKLHREYGPAVEYANGYKEWYLNGELHREGGPAVEYADGGKSWYLKGVLHREDGPAVEWSDGDIEWWFNGILLTKEDWFEKISEKSREKVLFNYNFILK